MGQEGGCQGQSPVTSGPLSITAEDGCYKLGVGRVQAPKSEGLPWILQSFSGLGIVSSLATKELKAPVTRSRAASPKSNSLV